MLTVIVVLGVVTAVAAAIRSTWSPCGLSMLSTITPFGERSRGHRFGATAAWFIVGSTLGGATLGLLTAGLAAGAAGAGLGHHRTVALAVVAAAALAAGAIDGGVFGETIPLLRRQVDDRWLGRYRSWVYGAGFGWQIGVGLATYIMTAGVLLTVVLGGLSAQPLVGGGLGIVFGLTRGLAVLLTRRAQSPTQLRDLHRRIEAVREPVRRSVIGVELAVAAVAAAALGGPAAAMVTGAAVGTLVVVAAIAGALQRTLLLRGRRSG